MQKVILNISDMNCASCTKTIEDYLKKQEGIIKAEVNFSTESATIKYDENILNESKIINLISLAGYTAAKEDINHCDQIKKIRKKFFISLIVSLPLMYIAMFHSFLPPFIMLHVTVIQFILATVVVGIGYEFFTKGFLALFKTKRANMDTLVALGVGSAYLYSVFSAINIWMRNPNFSYQNLYFEIAAFLVTFIMLGRYLEAQAKGKTSSALKKLIGLQPKKATVIRNNKEVEILISEVLINDIIVVKAGGKIPVDGIIVEGHSSVDESMITGESLPIEKTIGYHVIGGTINKNGSFNFKALKVGKDTVLSQIIEFVKKAQSSKAPIQKLTDTIAAFFVPIVITIAMLTFSLWIFIEEDFLFALTIFISVLIIACPCALGLAIPTAIVVGTGMGAEMGILIKNAESIQKMSKTNCIVFDKTGTLTEGKPVVTDILNFDFDKNDLISYSMSVEKKSQHPLADAIIEKAKSMSLEARDISNYEELPGHGAKAILNGKEFLIGNLKLMDEFKIDYKEKKHFIEHLMNEGKTTLIIAYDKKIIGIIGITDLLRPNVNHVIEKLNKIAYVLMMTGDTKKTAHIIAVKARIEYNNIIAEIVPKDKALEIKKLQEKDYHVAMVGDGINDAPALAQADVGISLGKGTDVAIESADIILMKNDIKDVYKVLLLSKYIMKKIKQNLFWAFIYNLLGIPVAAGVLYPFNGFLLNPAIAGAAMAFSSVSVVSNSLLMRRWKA